MCSAYLKSMLQRMHLAADCVKHSTELLQCLDAMGALYEQQSMHATCRCIVQMSSARGSHKARRSFTCPTVSQLVSTTCCEQTAAAWTG